MNGTLTIVGTGIKWGAHITNEAKAWIKQADVVFYHLGRDKNAANWLLDLNPNASDLTLHYSNGSSRLASYQQMVMQILSGLFKGQRVCAVFYGHPGVFVNPSHKVISRARECGFPAIMLPGISAEDCLFADLGIDPAVAGCQSYEATDFLIRPRQFDVDSGLVLWQIGMIGNLSAKLSESQSSKGMKLLVSLLISRYGAEHVVTVYEAAKTLSNSPSIQAIPLDQLASINISEVATLYVPPLKSPEFDLLMMQELGITMEMVR